MLPHVLSRSGPLPAGNPEVSEKIKKDQIYVAVPDCHLIIEDSVVRSVGEPRQAA